MTLFATATLRNASQGTPDHTLELPMADFRVLEENEFAFLFDEDGRCPEHWMPGDRIRIVAAVDEAGESLLS